MLVDKPVAESATGTRTPKRCAVPFLCPATVSTTGSFSEPIVMKYVPFSTDSFGAFGLYLSNTVPLTVLKSRPEMKSSACLPSEFAMIPLPGCSVNPAIGRRTKLAWFVPLYDDIDLWQARQNSGPT